MATNEQHYLDALDRDGRGSRACFTWSGDSYLQTISTVADGVAIGLIEADPSPPFQEIVRSIHKDWIECSANRPCEWPTLLLTGSGEGRYWSASVSAITDSRLAILSFDFACRFGRRASIPAVTFGIADGVRAELLDDGEDDDHSISLRATNGHQFYLGAKNRPISDDPETENQPTCRVVLSQSRITITPVGGPHFAKGPTVQWCFEISLARES